jgi:diguanylate cyclase (GGDEF)-like protein/PAS domain S-box-containing protein
VTVRAGLRTLRRSWLEQILGVVRQLGSSKDLDQTLEAITKAVVETLQFRAAAINVVVPQGQMRVAAVAGPPDLTRLLGQSAPLQEWTELLDACEPWGSLRFFSHLRDQAVVDRLANWTPDPGEGSSREPDSWHPEDCLFAPLVDSAGSLVGVLSVDQPHSGRRPDLEQQTALELFASQAAQAIVDTAARVRADARHREAELRWRLAFEHSPIGAAIVDSDGRFLQLNDAFVEMFGYSHMQLLHMTFLDLTHPDDVDLSLFRDLVAGRLDSFESEKRYVHATGQIVWGLVHIGVVRGEDDQVECIIGQVSDITDRKRAEQTLAHRATHDPLTNLPNRSLLEDRLASWLSEGRPAGVLFCDLDRFKTINDSLGHDAGDELLVAVARRLREVLPPEFTLGRVGGDEFVALAPGERDPEELRRLGMRLMSALKQPLPIRGHRHTVSVSIGVTVSGPWHEHPDEVLRQADQALLRAKRHGRSRVEVYDPTQDKLATVEDLELEQALRGALGEGHGLLPFFQPIVNLDDNTPVGYEALIRWNHPQRGLLEPSEFLPLAEQTGLVVAMGWWMLDVSCQAASRGAVGRGWSEWVAVNASGSQLGRGQLVPAICRALDTYDLLPERLHLEITETALVGATPAAIQEVRDVAKLGVRIALDDFGTGYSSLSLLRDLPVSAVKIDRSFVTPVAVDRRATAIVRSVIELCRELDVTTVAEGIETEEQMTWLRALGCTQAQGFLIGPPAPLAADVAGLAALRHRASWAADRT